MILLSDLRDEFFPKYFLFFNNKYFFVRLISYVFISLMILFFGILNSGQFIYFKY